MKWNIQHTLPQGESYPSKENVFRAFTLPLEEVKVVILGQDPYHDGSATGLAFDNKIGSKISPSLRNILSEVYDDMGCTVQFNSNSWLEHWHAQGVLLLNTALTVEPGKPGSHVEHWRNFTLDVIEQLSTKSDLIWILWGTHAQSFKPFINRDHFVIESGHPSPLARGAKVPFKGSKPFSRANQILTELGKTPIVW